MKKETFFTAYALEKRIEDLEDFIHVLQNPTNGYAKQLHINGSKKSTPNQHATHYLSKDYDSAGPEMKEIIGEEIDELIERLVMKAQKQLRKLEKEFENIKD